MKLDKQYLAIEGRPYCKKDYLKFKGYMCGICGEFIENGNIFIILLLILFNNIKKKKKKKKWIFFI